jgi:uncharacterized protein YgiM (DUF1202 family)
MFDETSVIEPNTPIKVIKGLQKGEKGKYLRKQHNSNWHVITIGAAGDEYFVNLDEIELDK